MCRIPRGDRCCSHRSYPRARSLPRTLVTGSLIIGSGTSVRTDSSWWARHSWSGRPYESPDEGLEASLPLPSRSPLVPARISAFGPLRRFALARHLFLELPTLVVLD